MEELYVITFTNEYRLNQLLWREGLFTSFDEAKKRAGEIAHSKARNQRDVEETPYGWSCNQMYEECAYLEVVKLERHVKT